MASTDLLTSPQAGALIGKSARTIQRMADSGELPFTQKLPGPNGAYLFTRSDLASYLARASEDPSSTAPVSAS